MTYVATTNPTAQTLSMSPEPSAASTPHPSHATRCASINPVALLRGIAREAPDLVTLTARGHAMRDALVNDGDVILVQRTTTVSDGERVVVRVKARGVTLIRRIYAEGDQLRLQPENHRLPAEILAPADVEIEGRVMAICHQDPSRQRGWQLIPRGFPAAAAG